MLDCRLELKLCIYPGGLVPRTVHPEQGRGDLRGKSSKNMPFSSRGASTHPVGRILKAIALLVWDLDAAGPNRLATDHSRYTLICISSHHRGLPFQKQLPLYRVTSATLITPRFENVRPHYSQQLCPSFSKRLFVLIDINEVVDNYR